MVVRVGGNRVPPRVIVGANYAAWIVVSAIIAWIILAVVMIARLGWGWRGRNAALLTIIAFSAVLLRMLGFY